MQFYLGLALALLPIIIMCGNYSLYSQTEKELKRATAFLIIVMAAVGYVFFTEWLSIL